MNKYINGTPKICADGVIEWRLEDILHRIDGPAVEYKNGTEEWWVNGKTHRLNGPAVSYFSGIEEWWIYNKKIVNPFIYKQWLIDNGIDINNITEDDEQLIELVWIHTKNNL